MAYFEYLRRTGLEYGPESYVMYLTEVCGYTEMYAKAWPASNLETSRKVLPRRKSGLP